MNRFPGFHGQDAERMSEMYPQMAQHIIRARPRRLFNHPEWGMLEYSTEILPPDSEKGQRVLIGICHSKNPSIEVATYVLYEDGTMYRYDPENARKIPYGIRYAHYQMLLTEGGHFGWRLDDLAARKKLAGAMGVKLGKGNIAYQPPLIEAMQQVRAAYAVLV